MQHRKQQRKTDPGLQQAATRGLVRVGPLMGLPAVLRQLGHDPAPILESTGFSLAQFEDPDAEISYHAGSRLLAQSVKITGCQHLGLLLGETAPPSSLGVAGFLLQSAPDVATALADLAANLDLHDTGGSVILATSDDTTLFGYAIHLPGVAATDQIYDLSLTVACNIMRGLCGRNWNPAEVLLTRRPPRDLAPYKRVFRASLHFNAEQNAIAFPSRWLKQKSQGADSLLYRHLQQEAVLLHTFRNGDVILQLRSLIRKSLQSGQCTEAGIAAQLSIHERTLHRKLREAGTGFREELDEVRYELAQQLLADSTMPIARIAAILNYADASAFSRAFRRWADASPAQWRALQARTE